MANVKPVKVLTNLVTKREIQKKAGNSEQILFHVSGNIESGGGIVGHVSSSLPITGTLIYTENLHISASGPFEVTELNGLINGPENKYNVDSAIHEIDKAIKKTGITDAVRAQEAVNAYKRLRYQTIGTFDADGYALVKLPITQSQYDFRTLTYWNATKGVYEPPVYDEAGIIGPDGNPLPSVDGTVGDDSADDPNFKSFPSSSIDYINVDVMVKSDSDVHWTNDIIAVHVTTGSDDLEQVLVHIYAPDLAGGSEPVDYRLLAVNEDPALYIIR